MEEGLVPTGDVDPGKRRVTVTDPRKMPEISTAADDDDDVAQSAANEGFKRSDTRRSSLGLFKRQDSCATFGLSMDQLVKQTSMFRDCSPDFVEAVLLRLKQRMLRPGITMILQGAPSPSSMFFVLFGALELVRMECEGEQPVICSEGAAFGEDMVFGISSQWRFTVRADVAAMVCELSSQSLQELLADFPEEKRHFTKVDEHRQLAVTQDSGKRWRALQQCAVLGCCSDQLLKALDGKLERRLYFPGQSLFSEGDVSPDLYLLELGSASIEISDRLVHLADVPHTRTDLFFGEDFVQHAQQRNTSTKKNKKTVDRTRHTMKNSTTSDSPREHGGRKNSPHGVKSDEVSSDGEDISDGDDDHDIPETVVFGEELMLKVSLSSTKTVRAKALCSVRVLSRKDFLSLLDESPADQAILEPWLDSYKKSDISREKFPDIQSHRPYLGCGCSQAFYDFLQLHIEERLFGVGEIIVLDESNKQLHHVTPDANISLCRINHGKVLMIDQEVAGNNEGLGVERRGSSNYGKRSLLVGSAASKIEYEEFSAGSVIVGPYFWKPKLIQAQEVSLVSILHRGIVARALEEYPDDREIFVHFLARQSQRDTKEQDKDRVARILGERSIFANTSPDFVDAILKCGVSRVFMPGDRIIEQGAEGSSMFILWLGASSVVNENYEDHHGYTVRTLTRVGTLPFGSVFGELVMLGVHQRRTASIIAATVCCAWEVAQTSCLSILAQHPSERASFLQLVETHLDKLAAPRIIYHPLLSCFHQQLRTFLGVKSERILSFPGEMIVQQGSAGDSLFVMNLGKAVVEMSHQEMMQITGGAYFGFGVMTGTQDRYPATVIAKTMCQVLIVHASTYFQALRNYPEMIIKAKALETQERVKQQTEKNMFAGVARRRKGTRSIIDALHGVVFGEAESATVREVLESSFHVWRNWALKEARARREEAVLRQGNERRIARYLEKRQHRMDNARQRMDLKRLVKDNLSERGPLKLAKQAHSASPSPRKILANSFEQSAKTSPYLSPNPVWRPGSLTARESSNRLPPLVAVAACARPAMLKASSVRSSSTDPAKEYAWGTPRQSGHGLGTASSAATRRRRRAGRNWTPDSGMQSDSDVD